jgi:hypothetical protein
MVISGSGSGKIPFEVDPNNIGHFLKGILGNEVVTLVSGTVYKHTFTPQNGALLPSFAPGVDDGVDRFQAKGFVMDSLTLDIAAGAIVEAAVDGFYAERGVLAPMTVTFSSVRPFVFSDYGLKVDASYSGNNKKLSVSVKNNLKNDDFRDSNGGRLKTIAAKAIDVSGSLDMDWNDETKPLQTKAMAGGYAQIVATMTGIEIIAGQPYKLVVTIPSAFLDSANQGNEEDGMGLPIPFTAAAGAQPVITFELYNDRATAY